MFESSPEYFRKYQKNFKYFTCESLPEKLTTHSSYAYAFHSQNIQNEHCKETNHYHVIVHAPENLVSPSHVYSVPCLYTSYKFLISLFENKFLKGEVFTKIESAVLLNKTTSFDKMSANMIRRQLPHLQKTLNRSEEAPDNKDLKRKHSQTQTDAINSRTLSRFQKLCSGPNCASLLLIMDILESGYGSYDHRDKDFHVKFSLTTNTV